MDKIAKLESKLAEYEVIEDDLANLKRYHQENKLLRAQLEAAGKGHPVAAVAAEPTHAAAAPAQATAAPTPAAAPAPAAAAAPTPPPPPAEAASPLAAAEENLSQEQAAQSFEGLVDKVEESLAKPATPAGASVVDPAAVAKAQTPAPPAQEAAPKPPEAAPAAPAAEAGEAPPAAEKSDADLLNEFERMLSS
jgi:hypothetical protein